MVLWSSQGLKDGPIVFFLALSILATLRLNRKFDVKYLLVLAPSLFALLSLRFYVFYMIAAAVGGAFVIGAGKMSATSFIVSLPVIIFRALALTYLVSCVFQRPDRTIRQSRKNPVSLRTPPSLPSRFSAQMTFPQVRALYQPFHRFALFALCPFPWQLASLRQSITLPGNGGLVGFVPLIDPGTLVFNQVSLTADFTDPDFHGYAFYSVLDFPGQRW